MEWIITLIMVIGALSIMGMVYGFINDKWVFTVISFLIAEICIIGIALIALNIYSNKEIPAIEVYRDNTMMIVTYQNNIPDSVVVYKNK